MRQDHAFGVGLAGGAPVDHPVEDLAAIGLVDIDDCDQAAVRIGFGVLVVAGCEQRVAPCRQLSETPRAGKIKHLSDQCVGGRRIPRSHRRLD